MTTVLQVREADPLAARSATTLPDSWTFTLLHDLGPLRRVQLIKQGLPATLPAAMAERMGLARERLYLTLALPRATIERKARESRPLSPDESARVLGLGRMVGQVQRMVEESGDPAGFDAGAWLALWLDKPLPALDGMRPAELMDTTEGQALVGNLLSRIQTGAYS